MTTGKKITGIIAAGIAGLALLGPRVRVDTKLTPVSVPEEVDTWLRDREAEFDDITPGTEKTIIWADSLRRKKTPFSLVYLHGFTASRQETAPLSDRIAAELGANLFYTRLAGHGRGGPAMGDVTVNDWLNDVVEALAIGRRLGEKVIVIGTSTGATLATWAAAQPELAADLAALVMLSPNFGPRDWKTPMLLWPWGLQLARAVGGDTIHWEPRSDIQDRYSTMSYPVDAALPMMALVRLARKSRLRKITLPVFVAFSDEDRVVDSGLTRKVLKRFKGTDVKIETVTTASPPNFHVIAGDMHAPQNTEWLADEIVTFLRERAVPDN